MGIYPSPIAFMLFTLSLATLFPYGCEIGGNSQTRDTEDYAMQTKGMLKPVDWDSDIAKYVVSVKGDWDTLSAIERLYSRRNQW